MRFISSFISVVLVLSLLFAFIVIDANSNNNNKQQETKKIVVEETKTTTTSPRSSVPPEVIFQQIKTFVTKNIFENNFNYAKDLIASASSLKPDEVKDIALGLPGRFLNFLSPAPLSPLFQKGGVFENFNEDLIETLIVMVILGIVDLVIVKPFIMPASNYDDNARYYTLHVVANAIATVASFPDVYRALFVDPHTAFSGPSSTMWANSAIAAIHIYHCVFFKLSAADIFHHATFVSILCGAAIPWKNIGGVANNLGCFFLSGLPGGIDYVLLVLVKIGKMSKLKEKELNCEINQWIRGPSMSIYAALGLVNFVLGSVAKEIPITAFALIVLLHFYNGQYYARQVFESYAVHKERAKLEKQGLLISPPASPLGATAESKKKK
jgi:hypothetical protein